MCVCQKSFKKYVYVGLGKKQWIGLNLEALLKQWWNGALKQWWLESKHLSREQRPGTYIMVPDTLDDDEMILV